VWLDRGELDKIIERSDMGGGSVPQQRPTQQYNEERRYESSGRDTYDRSDHQYQQPKKKRESFLGDLFDF
jgi:Zn-finger nucleic acid-binding protein